MKSNKQRSRTSFLLPLVASIKRSTSCDVRCFRSLTSASTPLPVFPRRSSSPCRTLRFSPFWRVDHFVESESTQARFGPSQLTADDQKKAAELLAHAHD